MKPILLLDVDGVLCPFGGDPPPGYRLVYFGADADWISQENVNRLMRLQERFDIVWATAREHDVHGTIAGIHALGRLPVIEFGALKDNGVILLPAGSVRGPGTTWKLPWIAEWADDGQAFAWLDDDIQADAQEWASKRKAPTLLAPVDPRFGLTDMHVAMLIDWGEHAARTD